MLIMSFSVLVWGCNPNQNEKTGHTKPNILLIVADDMGYTDLGSFGGDINTPNLDALAERGVAFSRFHTAPFCAVTRAMMLSGNDNHIAGMGSQDLVTEHFGYEGQLTDRIVPLPALLRKAGYHTSMAGKWHLGSTDEANPHNKGFERSFTLLSGAGNHYNSTGYSPERPVESYTEDGKIAGWPEGAYSTDFYTDKLISYIDQNRNTNQPFFVFASYTSPHWPLQVDPEYRKKYEGRYDEGYDVLKKKRFERQKELGLIPDDAELPPNHPRVTPWDSLSQEHKQFEARKMELYAGMVDNLDVNVGRLIDYLQNTGQYENTLIVFFSDNGAAAEDFYHHEYFGPFLQEHYTEDYDSMGDPDSFISYGPQWAEAGASPFKYFKGYTTQGGISAPLIVAGPGVKQSGVVSHAFSTLMDLAPTLYELAGIEYPDIFNGNDVYPLRGASLMPVLVGESEEVHDENYVFALEHRGYMYVRKGDWKLVNTTLPFDESNFELHDLSQDLAEQVNLRDKYPNKYKELLEEWEKYRQEVEVQIPTPERGSGP